MPDLEAYELRALFLNLVTATDFFSAESFAATRSWGAALRGNR